MWKGNNYLVWRELLGLANSACKTGGLWSVLHMCIKADLYCNSMSRSGHISSLCSGWSCWGLYWHEHTWPDASQEEAARGMIYHDPNEKHRPEGAGSHPKLPISCFFMEPNRYKQIAAFVRLNSDTQWLCSQSQAAVPRGSMGEYISVSITLYCSSMLIASYSVLKEKQTTSLSLY